MEKVKQLLQLPQERRGLAVCSAEETLAAVWCFNVTTFCNF